MCFQILYITTKFLKILEYVYYFLKFYRYFYEFSLIFVSPIFLIGIKFLQFYCWSVIKKNKSSN